MRKCAIDEANSMKIRAVFVSPYRRTLQTAYHVLKTHPDFNSISFIVIPKLREQLYGMADIPINIDDTIKDFKPLFANINFDLFNDYEDRVNYFYTDLQQSLIDETKDKICYCEDDPIKNNIADLFVPYIKENYPEPFESKILYF